ncbi:hypothetical protein M440DRAFT_1460969 [Trichoderma longibrachiatum ATCC 18648]|uniref:Uncharacterized protein n=1 Tax=Trichoderma longibrachiatum ATCC 18648 TaxID=983965 RepID=A0A2T4CCW1_TRILO|nr:hypothetical protein M440DRAFT_1460969 [Trichoderma longibrachiatum ATCC 18648]
MTLSRVGSPQSAQADGQRFTVSRWAALTVPEASGLSLRHVQALEATVPHSKVVTVAAGAASQGVEEALGFPTDGGDGRWMLGTNEDKRGSAACQSQGANEGPDLEEETEGRQEEVTAPVPSVLVMPAASWPEYLASLRPASPHPVSATECSPKPKSWAERLSRNQGPGGTDESPSNPLQSDSAKPLDHIVTNSVTKKRWPESHAKGRGGRGSQDFNVHKLDIRACLSR